MAIAYVGNRYAAACGGSGTSRTVVPTAACAVGDLLILAIALTANVSVTSVTDSKGNVWRLDKIDSARFCAVVSCYVTTAITTSDTITITLSGASDSPTAWAILEEYSGLPNAVADVRLSADAGTGTALAVGPTGATSYPDELVLAFFYVNGTRTLTAGAGYTQRGTISAANSLAVEDKVVAATGTQSAAMTNSAGSTSAFGVIATYRTPPAAPDTLPQVVLDDFNRASLGANWTNQPTTNSGVQIFGSTVMGSSNSATRGMSWNANSFTGRMQVEVKVPTVPGASQNVGIGFGQNLGSSSGWDAYWLAFATGAAPPNAFQILYIVDGAVSAIIFDVRPVTLNAGDTLLLDFNATTGLLQFWRKLVSSGAWEFIGSVVHGGLTGTFQAFVRGANTTWRVDDFTVYNSADATPPTDPAGLGATAYSATEIDLAWTASTDAVGVTGYSVERKTGAGSYAEVATPTTTSLHDTGLSPSTTYTYRVRARDAGGNWSGYSNEASATTPAAGDTTPPSTPTGLGATAISDTEIDVAWTASTDAVGVTGYKLERKTGAGSFAEIATPTGTSYSDTGLDPSTTYTYRVRARDAAGNISGYSSEASATTEAPPDVTAPGAPTDLTVAPTSTTETHLNWSPATDDTGVTGYRVERSTGGAFTEIATVTGTSYTDTGLDPGTVYVYRVRAQDAAGNLSGYTAPADAVTDVEPTQGVSLAYEDWMLEPNPTWTRLDATPSLVASYSVRRGRQDELEKTGTGTASFELSDRDGTFDPTTGIPQFDGVQAALALRNPCTGDWSTIFRGFTDTWDFDLHPSGIVTGIKVELVDALDYLAGVEIAPESNGDEPEADVELAEGDIYYVGDQVNLRIRALLTEAQWPSELRTIFTGNVYVKEQIASAGTSILALLQDAADAEFPGVANLYVSKIGKVTFHGRHARFHPDETADSAGTAWKFTRWKAGDGSATDDPTYAQLRGLGFARSRKQIINAALAYPNRSPDVEPEIKSEEMAAQRVISPTSIDRYGIHSWSAENLMTHRHKTEDTDDLEETKRFATYYVQNYSQPETRLTQLVFRSLRPDDPRAPATWALLCGVEISDIVSVRTQHAGPGGFVDEEFYVEGISYEVRPLAPGYADVTLSLDVSPVAYYSDDSMFPNG